MIQKEIYTKDITREINGVIKASSDNQLAIEINEFVITAEQMKPMMLPILFNQLVPPSHPNCVWISGDFGSGKSHLLKILSYVLENKLEVEGKPCAEIFAAKAGDDFELKGNIQKACRIPTESVLFNIQEKLDGIAKGGIDPVLNIFVKEFNRKMGFDDKKPEVAEIERYFDNKGKYQWFKDEYQRRYNKSWEDGRKSILLKQQELAAILADLDGITSEVALQNIKTQISNYKLDTDGFTNLVKEHLAKQPQGARFIFFVDEVGQFIGKDVHRMLSLQTIAESLSDKTNGQAIMMVTSQMDIDATLGNLEKQQEYDFSRIQGRFTTRLNLTSANADEVIQRRLLEKKAEPEQQLKLVYEDNRNIIKSLFNFGETSQYKTSYKSAEQFAIDFPFVDYQFNLLQNAIIELSKNNAFSGKQQSVGERSLLTITQEVAKVYKDKDLNQIVQFSDMYEGLRGILQTKIQTDIQQAERTLNDDLALKVLKVLFMVKYVKGFPSNTDNITKLLLPTLTTDFPSFTSEVRDALNKLVHLSYIEKGANDEYHYQTNEEKDIETEIKNEELQPDAINNELKKVFRDEIYSETKVKLSNYKTFIFTRFVDESQDGRDADLAIHFITLNNTTINTDPQAMLMYSTSHANQLCVVLGEDKYLGEDLAMFKKADKCLTRLLSGGQGDYRQQIVSDKRTVNRKRRESIVERLTLLTKDARLYLAGQELTDIRQTDLKARLNEGMSRLVYQVYTNLKMLQKEYNDDLLRQILNTTTSGALFARQMDNCMQEVFNFIQRQKSQSIRVKVKDLVDTFRGGNYGWYELATLCIIAELYKMDKISFRSNGNVVTDRDLYNHLTNSNQQAMLIVDVEETITPSQIKNLRDAYKDLFDGDSCAAQSAKDVYNEFISRLNLEITRLDGIKNTARFRFTAPVNSLIESLRPLASCVYPTLYSKSNKIEDAIDQKEEVEEIISFVEGSQFNIFKSVDTLLTGNNANLGFVTDEYKTELDTIYNGATPWREMTRAKELLDKIRYEVTERQNTEREAIKTMIDAKLGALQALPTFAVLAANQQEQIIADFNALEQAADSERFIGNLMAMAQQVNTISENSVKTINHWIEQKEEEERRRAQQQGGQGQGSGQQQPPRQHTVSTRKLVGKDKAMKLDFSKPMLENKDDVEAYISQLRQQLLDIINDNKNILLS